MANQSNYLEASSELKRYSWHGQNRAGQMVTGVLYCQDKEQVREQLALRGIMALQIRATREPVMSRASRKEVTRFLQELATLYDAGVPLLRILDVQLYSQPKPYFRDVIQTIRMDVERGENLHTALAHHPKVFDQLTCNLIASGEESGRLSEVLNNIVHSQEQQQKIRAQIQTALWYPLFVLAVALVVWGAIMIFVVPVFESIYRASGRNLPWLTQFLINSSHTLRQYWYITALAIVLLSWLLARFIRGSAQHDDALHRFLDRMRLKIPLIGSLLRMAWHAQFARTLGLLHQSGVPLHSALQTSALTVSGGQMRHAIYAVTEDVLNGHPLSVAMTQYPVFEAGLIARVQIGEESGALSKMLLQHATHNEFVVEQGIKRLSTLIEPVLILVIGAIVALVVIALYLPILNLGSAIR